MPVSIGTMKFTCKECGFSKVIPTQGDVLLMPNLCEKCGCSNLSVGHASILEGVLFKVWRLLKS